MDISEQIKTLKKIKAQKDQKYKIVLIFSNMMRKCISLH